MHFTSIIYRNNSANPENLAKIGPADVETIGLTVVIIFQNKKNISPPSAAAGRANMVKFGYTLAK